MTRDTDDSEQSLRSPTALPAVLSAFASAGRRRQTSEDQEHEKDRAREREIQKARQQQIQQRAPGRRANGRTRVGDIDGMIYSSVLALHTATTVMIDTVHSFSCPG